jgi:hypothetical protein
MSMFLQYFDIIIDMLAIGKCIFFVKYSRVCYNERSYNERMLQRTVFINKFRMLQRTRYSERRRILSET